MKKNAMIFKLNEIKFFVSKAKFVIKFLSVRLFIICSMKKKFIAGKRKFINKSMISEIKKIIGLKIVDDEIFPVMKIKFIIKGKAELIKLIRLDNKVFVIEKEFLNAKNKLLMIII